MEAFLVQEGAFSDFGMSVKTNFGVAAGENVQWMEVSGLEPGGSAQRNSLLVGDRILAIDRQLVTTLDRFSLQTTFFQRKKGEQARFLIMSPNDGFPRFVVLTASRP